MNPTPHAVGELSWRVGMALASLNFVLLALAVIKINNRSSRGMSLAIALLISQIYLNLLSVGQGWVVTQQISVLGFMVGLHGGVFARGVLWLYMRHVQFDATGWLRHSLLATRIKPLTVS